MEFSVSKSKALHITKRRKPQDITLHYGGREIEMVNEIKYLGVVFDIFQRRLDMGPRPRGAQIDL